MNPAILMDEELIDLRQQIGLSQQELADFLGIQRTALAHAERGTRNINARALHRLDALFFAADNVEEKNSRSRFEAWLEEDREEVALNAEDQLGNIQTKLERLTSMLQHLEKEQDKVAFRLEFAHELKENIPANDIWPQILLDKSRMLYGTCAEDVVNLVKARICGAEAELKFWEETVQQNQPKTN